MFRLLRILSALVVLLIALPASAFADDWLVTKLRGTALQLVGAEWQPLERGDVVPDDRVIRTMGGTRAMLQRDKETIEVAANTQLRIIDRPGSRKFTTVQQFFGTVAIEAEVQNVQHFAVQTPYLVAVVKGTRFEVKTSSKQSVVKVQRGQVAVEDVHTGAHALIPAGQTATVANGGSFKVTGSGRKAIIYNAAGQAVAAAAAASGKLSVAAGVNTGVANVAAGVNGSGAQVGVTTPAGNVSVEVDAGQGGANVNVNVGGNGGVGVSAGGGNGVSVSVGGSSVGAGLGGLL